MKTRVIRTAITELDENEAYDLCCALQAFTDNSKGGMATPLPTDKQVKVAALFAAQLSETLG